MELKQTCLSVCRIMINTHLDIWHTVWDWVALFQTVIHKQINVSKDVISVFQNLEISRTQYSVPKK